MIVMTYMMLNVSIVSITDGLEQEADDEMQVVDVDCASDGSIELTLDGTEEDVGCILILNVQFDVVSV